MLEMLSRNLALQIASAFSTILYVLVDDPPAGIHALPVANMTSSFWLNSSANPNPLRNVGSDGPLTPDADVCIIGSGLTGVSAAYHLSQSEIASHLKVVVLEAREFCELSEYPFVVRADFETRRLGCYWLAQ